MNQAVVTWDWDSHMRFKLLWDGLEAQSWSATRPHQKFVCIDFDGNGLGKHP
jgi:hypothetical protein